VKIFVKRLNLKTRKFLDLKTKLQEQRTDSTVVSKLRISRAANPGLRMFTG